MGLVSHAGFDNGEGLLKQLVADGNQGQLLVFTLGHDPLVESFAGRVGPASGPAAQVKLAADQVAAGLVDARLAAHARAEGVLMRAEPGFGNELAVVVQAGEAPANKSSSAAVLRLMPEMEHSSGSSAV